MATRKKVTQSVAAKETSKQNDGCKSCGLKITPPMAVKMEANKILTALASSLEGQDSEDLMRIAATIDLYIQPHFAGHQWRLGVLEKATNELTDIGPIVSLVK
jgi:hypothetical protein